MNTPDLTQILTNPAPTDAAAVSGGVATGTESTARGAANNTLAAQVELMQINMEFMIAMAWLNFVLAVTSKLNGR